MADDQYDYKAGPAASRCIPVSAAQSGNPGGRSKKKLHALLAHALNGVFVSSTENVARSQAVRQRLSPIRGLIPGRS
jgi:hypothetical protein